MGETIEIPKREVDEILRIITNVYENAQKDKFDFVERDAKDIIRKCNYILDCYSTFE